MQHINQKRIKLLDCTLRDGGYYLDWDFDDDLVRKYLAAVNMAQIDIVELGFRFLPQRRFLGAFAYSTDDYLKSLPLPAGVEIAVMVNASDLFDYPEGAESAVHCLFNACDDSPLDIVRIAARAIDIERCQSLAGTLKEKNYRVFLNLMQVDALTLSELEAVVSEVAGWGCIECLYFADSFGSMDPEFVVKTFQSISTIWDGDIGFHAHDNKGLALANSLSAVDAGIEYVDSTVLGMGRGAGNVRTEQLLLELVERGQSHYFPDAIFPLVLHEFQELKSHFNWGTNIYYHLSAVHGIHPTYVQEILGDDRYGTEQVLTAIRFLKGDRQSSFSFEKMLRAISGIAGDEDGIWSANGWADGRDVVIIGAGPSTKKYTRALSKLVSRLNALVLCLNLNEDVPSDLVTAYVASYESRILIESDQYVRLNKKIILPLARLPDMIKKSLKEVDVLDYGLRIEEDAFTIKPNGCVLGAPLAIAYAMSVATAANAQRILLVGVDGYGRDDPRQKEMDNLFHRYSQLEEALPVIALTPTSYPVEQRSIFESHI
jgi:4-hydroxy 2-oxovalerate aldolase